MTLNETARHGDSPFEETTPLLLAGEEANQPPERSHGKLDRGPFVAIALVLVINYLYTTGQMLVMAPRMQIYESLICHDYASRDQAVILVDEGRCKEADIQGQLAFVLGIEELLTVFLSVLSIPYSFLANRYGICFILSLSMVGFILEITWSLVVCMFSGRVPLQWVWLGVSFEAIGGGPTVTVTMFNLLLAKQASQESRTRIFLFFGVGTLLAAATGQAASTLMMYSDIWLPAYIGVITSTLALGLSFLLNPVIGRNDKNAQLLGGNVPEQETRNGSRRSIKELGMSAIERCHDIWAVLRGNPQIAIVLFSAFAFPLGEDSMYAVILLYISKRYGWKIADANLLIALSSLARLFTFLVGVPLVGSMLVARAGTTPYTRDRTLVRIEGIILMIGALCLAFAPTVALATCGVVIISLGMAVVTILRSLVTDLVHSRDVALVYSMMTMMMRIGSGVAGPIFAWGFSQGIKMGPSWIGLPFTMAAGFFLTGSVALAFISKQPLSQGQEDQNTDNS